MRACSRSAGRIAMFKKSHLIFVVAALFTTTPALSQDGAWTMKQPLPAPRNEVALAAVGGKLYVVGGSVGGEAVPLIDEYDPPSNGWRAGKPMPKGLDHLGVAVIGSKIITIGGFLRSGPPRGGQPRFLLRPGQGR